jgi:uncharacterized membrane protein YgaE (UPF0421/DUF939 family)
MTELIIYFLGFFFGFILSIFLLSLNHKINNYRQQQLMNEVNNFYKQILSNNDKTEKEKKEDIINFMVDKIIN